MKFSGFPAETLTFLQQLRANNNRSWFHAHRAEYESGYLGPARRFVISAGEHLRQFAPDVVAQARVSGSIFRINRDIRFSKDQTPYKDHLDLWFWEGQRRGALSGFFVRFAPESIAVGAGCHAFDSARLRLYRQVLSDERVSLKLAGMVKALEKNGYEIGGSHYKRLPKECVADNPFSERFLLHNALYVRCEIAVDERLRSEEILHVCVRHWNAMAPLHHWLMQHLATAPTP